MSRVLVDHIREHATEFLVRLEPLEIFHRVNGVALYGQVVETVGRCIGHAVAGRTELAERNVDLLGDSLLRNVPAGPIQDEIQDALNELRMVVLGPVERLH